MGEGRREAELAQIEQERDLYLRLLRLGAQDELEPFLKEALALVTDVTGAKQVYLELRDPDVDDSERAWRMVDRDELIGLIAMTLTRAGAGNNLTVEVPPSRLKIKVARGAIADLSVDSVRLAVIEVTWQLSYTLDTIPLSG